MAAADRPDPEHPARASVLAPIGVALGYWLAAMVSLALTRGGDGIAAMWPASGLLLAGLLWLPRRAAPATIGWTVIGSMAANLHAGNAAAQAAVFTSANASEALLAAWIVGRTGARRLSFIDPRDVGRFALAATAAAGWSAGIASLAGPGDVLFAASWFTTVLLGILIVAPAALIAVALVERDGPMPTVGGWEGAILFAMVAAVTALAFSQPMPLLFLPLVALLGVTYRLGPIGAAGGVLVVAVIGSVLTGAGFGPIAATDGVGEHGVFLFQFFLLVSFAAALPLAAILAAQRRLAGQCAASERMHRLLADTSSDIIARLTPAGEALYVSSAVERVLGYPPEAVVGQAIRAIHPDDRGLVEAVWQALVETGEDQRFVFRQRRRDGGCAWLEAGCRIAGGEVVASIRDVTKRRAAEAIADAAVRRTTETNRLLAMAERVAQVGHWRLSFADRAVFWSSELFRIHGVPEGATPAYEDALDLYHPDDRARVTAAVENALVAAAPFETEARLLRPDGRVRHVVVRGHPELDDTGGPAGLFGVMQDVTRQVLAERELDAALRAAEAAAARAIRMADTDALTGVASRRKALAVLDEALDEAEAGGTPLALAIFDIDHFKAVNDRWGHAAGDAVLRRVARAARQAVRPTDMVGRLGGEEFVVILPGLGAERAMEVAETLRRTIEGSAGGDAGPPVTVSVGLALRVPGGNAASLLGDADRALYGAKAAGRNAARLAA